jgi:hypothetical protein
VLIIKLLLVAEQVRAGVLLFQEALQSDTQAAVAAVAEIIMLVALRFLLVII